MKFEIATASYLLNELAIVTAEAKKRTKCLRKGVGCSIHDVSGIRKILSAGYNGPSRDGVMCTNVIGGCGCAHAEPRAVMEAMRMMYMGKYIMVCTYSPCQTCANYIIDSGIVHGVVYDILTVYPPHITDRGFEFLTSAMDVLTADGLRNFLRNPRQDVVEYDTIRKWKSPNL